jgi:hypothetical protein
MGWLFQGSEAELQALSDSDFVGVWSALFGEPPAAMIARPEMIALMRAALNSKRRLDAASERERRRRLKEPRAAHP